MIYDSINNHSQYAGLGHISDALQFLSKLDVTNIPAGKIEMNSDHMYANVIELSSKAEEDCVFEAHHRYIDVHYILKGVEGIGYAKVEKLAPMHEFDVGKDIGFYSGIAEGKMYLSAGDFMVCAPGEAHMVAIQHDEPNQITKIVVKIKCN